ncbi:MAG: hypothetical protein JSS07_06015 [Proteobacteria bacterium]|nr:hypothetical protein [Pseudomonadota bacterium]
MKTHIKPSVTLALGSILISFCSSSYAITMKPDDMRLPDDIKVHFSEKVGLTHSATKGAKSDVLPTNNDYKDAPGCYIACYSSNSTIASKLGAYPVDNKTFIMGQVRVKGHYYNGLCIPTGFENKSLKTAKEMKEACEKSFPAMCEKESCWANGNTSHWFY